MNISLALLSISSFGRSPQFSFSNTQQLKSITFHQINSNHFLKQFMFVSSDYFTITFKQSTFKNFLKVPIKIRSSHLSARTKNLDLSLANEFITSHISYTESALNVNSCLFENCLSNSYGGAIEYVSEQGQLTVNSTSFNSCSSTFKSAAIYLNGNYSTEIATFTHSSTIQHCCFMDCIGKDYGITCFLCSFTSELNNSYSVGCHNVPNSLGLYPFQVISRKFYSEYFNISKSNLPQNSGLLTGFANPCVIKYHTNMEHSSQFITYSYDASCHSQYSYINYYNISLNNLIYNCWTGLLCSSGASVDIDHCWISNVRLGDGQTVFNQNYDGHFSINACYSDIMLKTSGNVFVNNVNIQPVISTGNFVLENIESCHYEIENFSMSVDSNTAPMSESIESSNEPFTQLPSDSSTIDDISGDSEIKSKKISLKTLIYICGGAFVGLVFIIIIIIVVVKKRRKNINGMKYDKSETSDSYYNPNPLKNSLIQGNFASIY